MSYSLISILQSISDVARLILFFSVLIACIKFRKFPLEIKILSIFLMGDLGTELIAKWLADEGTNNMSVLHVYTVFEFIIFTLFYRALFKEDYKIQKYTGIWIGGITILIICNSIFWEPLDVFNSNAKTLVQLTLIAYAVLYFFRSFGNIDFTLPRNFVLALVNSAVLIYYSGTLFIFMFSKLLNTPGMDMPRQTLLAFWTFNSILFLIFQILMFFALWRTTRIRTL